MNPEIKALWLKALRSGEYQQTACSLKGLNADNKIGYCCLGVLTDLAVKAGIGEWNEDGKAVPTHRFIAPDSEFHAALLADEVRDWSGMPSADGTFPRHSAEWTEHINLAGMNDGGRTFEEIADAIETHF